MLFFGLIRLKDFIPVRKSNIILIGKKKGRFYRRITASDYNNIFPGYIFRLQQPVCHFLLILTGDIQFAGRSTSSYGKQNGC